MEHELEASVSLPIDFSRAFAQLARFSLNAEVDDIQVDGSSNVSGAAYAVAPMNGFLEALFAVGDSSVQVATLLTVTKGASTLTTLTLSVQASGGVVWKAALADKSAVRIKAGEAIKFTSNGAANSACKLYLTALMRRF